MALENVAPILDRHFVLSKLDVDRTLGGEEILTSYRGSDRGGIPWFVFLGEGGRTLVTADGPEGNVGCPYTDAEIAAFGTMLKKAAPRLTGAEWEILRKSLVAQREELERRRADD